MPVQTWTLGDLPVNRMGFGADAYARTQESASRAA